MVVEEILKEIKDVRARLITLEFITELNNFAENNIKFESEGDVVVIENFSKLVELLVTFANKLKELETE
jgi:hypothetical protein